MNTMEAIKEANGLGLTDLQALLTSLEGTVRVGPTGVVMKVSSQPRLLIG